MANNEETINPMSPEDRLEAVVYQFITLYERWAEDRQAAAKQGADTAKLVKEFTEQVEEFKNLEPSVKMKLKTSIERSFNEANAKVDQKLSLTANNKISDVLSELNKVSYGICTEFKEFKTAVEVEKSYGFWKSVAISVLCCIISSALIVKWFVPSSVVKVTDRQVRALSVGFDVSKAWPKLSKKEQDRIMELANPATNSAEERY